MVRDRIPARQLDFRLAVVVSDDPTRPTEGFTRDHPLAIEGRVDRRVYRLFAVGSAGNGPPHWIAIDDQGREHELFAAIPHERVLELTERFQDWLLRRRR